MRELGVVRRRYAHPVNEYLTIMFTRLILFLLVALGGAGLTMQMAWNSRLRAATGSPVLTTIISVVVTLISLILVWASGATPRGSIPAFTSLPRWAWFGGILDRK